VGINMGLQVPPEITLNDSPFFMYESGGETSRNESLADDNTTLLLMKEENLRSLRNILNSFGTISGLICNFEKTVILPIGKSVSRRMDYAGFAVCDSVKLLGMQINNNLDNTDEIFITLGEKILNLILFWNRFRLTLSGRIAILKTLLLPQINYLGCILTPSRYVIDGLQKMLDDFALDNIPCAVARRYLPPGKGGLGLIHIGTFLMAQKCAWVNRAHKNTIDNWRLKLRLLSPDSDITAIRLCDVDQIKNPIIYNIIEAYTVFTNCYTKIGNNYSVVPIFCNPFFVRSKHDNNLLDKSFFGSLFFEAYKNRIRTLTYSDCFILDRYRNLEEFANIGLPLSQTLWLRLRAALLTAKVKCINNRMDVNNIPTPKTISGFLNTVKRGSKKFRDVIDKSVYNDINVTSSSTLKSFCEINSITIPDSCISEHFLSNWNFSFLDNNLREFIYKCRNNILKTNDRLSHVIDNIDQTCYMCRSLTNVSQHRETFNHLFRSWAIVSTLILNISKKFKITFPNNNFCFDQAYWFGNVCGNLDKSVLLFFDLFRYHLWCCKTNKTFPRDDIMADRICGSLLTIFQVKPSIKNAFRNSIILCNVLQATG
jgi:hypothetical protein